jgi:hypothetical protein
LVKVHGVQLTIPVDPSFYNTNFRYRISGVQASGCGYNTYLYVDNIVINTYGSCEPCPEATNAGSEQTHCNDNVFTTSATPAPDGSTGTWSVVSGAASINDVNAPATYCNCYKFTCYFKMDSYNTRLS